MTPEESDHNYALILRAMQYEPWVCIHQILAQTKIPNKLAMRHLARLRELGKVRKVLQPGQDDVMVWSHVHYEPPDPTKIQPASDVQRASPVVGLTERQALDRIIMLNRMKERLIKEWHPVIDVILNDYKRDLGRVQGDIDFVLDVEDDDDD